MANLPDLTDAITAGTTTITGPDGAGIEAYLATPSGARAPHGGVVIIHHLPGYDAATKEIVRKFAVNGYAAICPNLYTRQAPGMSPDDAAALVRAAGGIPDAQLVGDVTAARDALAALPDANGKVGVIGYCSGGRHTVLAACSARFDAAVDCYGAWVVGTPPPDWPIPTMTSLQHLLPDLSCPLLGLFGAEDANPSPEQTAILEQELSAHGKTFEFHTYEGAGHAFFAVDRPAYRPAAAVDGWEKVFAWFGRYLSS